LLRLARYIFDESCVDGSEDPLRSAAQVGQGMPVLRPPGMVSLPLSEVHSSYGVFRLTPESSPWVNLKGQMCTR
jgi:hypothetical protein